MRCRLSSVITTIHPNTHAETELFCWSELAFWEKGSGPKHPDEADCLSALAGLYYEPGHYAEAERLYALALAIREKTLVCCPGNF